MTPKPWTEEAEEAVFDCLQNNALKNWRSQANLILSLLNERGLLRAKPHSTDEAELRVMFPLEFAKIDAPDLTLVDLKQRYPVLMSEYKQWVLFSQPLPDWGKEQFEEFCPDLVSKIRAEERARTIEYCLTNTEYYSDKETSDAIKLNSDDHYWLTIKPTNPDGLLRESADHQQKLLAAWRLFANRALPSEKEER